MISSTQLTWLQDRKELKDLKEVKESAKKKDPYGKTIGEPQLSDKAKGYYEQLKAKYSDKDFILVSKDMKETAKAQAGRYANPNKMVVLIDEEKIERMAEDEDYRATYELIISNAGNQLSQMKEQMGPAADAVKAFGMQVNEGGASFFAVLDKSAALQRERIAKQAEDKKAEKKEAAKLAEKKQELKKAEERKEEKRIHKKEEEEKRNERIRGQKENLVVIKANSQEELIQKIQDYYFALRSDNVFTESELSVGQSFDVKL